MKNINIESIIFDFGTTLVEVSETVYGKDQHKGYYKFEGEHADKNYLLFCLINLPLTYVECNEFEESHFHNREMMESI